MALQQFGQRFTRPVDGAPATAVEQYRILVVSTVNPGNVALSGQGALGFAGVSYEPSDSVGYIGIQSNNNVQIRAGANITVGQTVYSDSVGRAIPDVPSPSGRAEIQIVGTAIGSALAGNLVDVALHPALSTI